MKINIKLPRVEYYRDYHEIYSEEEKYQDVCNDRKIKIRELGCADGCYWAIMYYNKRPNKKVIEKLLNKENVTFADFY